MLGNSLTYENNMPAILANLTGAEVIQNTRGGARLAEQYNPKTCLGTKTIKALENEDWDYVVLQEMSNGPITSNRAFMTSVERLCDMVRESGAVPVLYATWAYKCGSSLYDGMNCDYEQMVAGLSEAYQTAAEKNNALIADVGKKFYEMSKTLELYAEDGLHPNETGSKIAAETIASVIKAHEDSQKKVTNIVVHDINKKDPRLRMLYMYQILLRYSDSEHMLTTNQIRNLMMQEYGIPMHRTTLPGDIEALRAAGFKIVGRRYRQNKYYLECNQFELPELKILIDAVESSKFITEKKSRKLVEKLVALTSEANAGKLKRNLLTSGRVRSGNEKGYYIVDAINEAINTGKRISFLYTDYDGKKRLILRNEGKPYIISPYTLVWNGDYYYLVGYDHAKDAQRTYRVDRILKQPVVLDDAAIPVPKDFDVARYTKEVFRMFENEEQVEVTLVCNDDVMKGVIDKFGMDINIKRVDKDYFKTKVMVCTSPTFFGWVFQWGGKIRIEGPEEVVQGYKKMLQLASE